MIGLENYANKQQRYATNAFEIAKQTQFDSQFKEKMREMQVNKIAENDRQILKQFDDNLKGCKEHNKVNCTITSLDQNGMLHC